MMPLAVADIGAEVTVAKVSGSDEMRQHLKDLGFVVGESVEVISKNGENVIVKVKDTRLALGRDMARKIMV